MADQAKADGKRGGSDPQTKALKTALEVLHAEVRSAEGWFSHIRWLRERFSEPRYDCWVCPFCHICHICHRMRF